MCQGFCTESAFILMVLIGPTNHIFGRDMPFDYCPKILKSEIFANFWTF